MQPAPLYYVWDYTDVDRAFWAEHLEGWLPRRILDAHTHITNPAHRLEPMTDQMRRQFWVNEAADPIDAPTARRCIRSVFPGREVTCVAMGSPSLAFNVEAGNEYVRAECLASDWHALAVLVPQWPAERVAAELEKPGVIGLKPYYALIGRDPTTRDRYQEAGIFDFLPHHALEVADERGAWITLHVPKADRLGHPDNIREVRELRRRYPNVTLVIAHLGRSYTEPHAREALPAFADDPGLYFDISAVLNPAVLRLAFELLGPGRLLYGTDNPVFYMRGRRQWRGRAYINRTSHPFHFNKEREAPEVEARYTLFMYEALKAIKDVCGAMGYGRAEVEALFHGNAARLVARVLKQE
jgi:predicted TIM-barrel fold metal-dependent hydrolase